MHWATATATSDCLYDNETYHAHPFIFSFHFNFLFAPCGRLKLATRQLFTAR